MTVLGLACAKPYFLAPFAPPASALPTLLVLPLNFEFMPPNSWLDGMSRIDQALHAHLNASGFSLRTATLRATLADWTSAVQSVGGLENAHGELDPERYAAARAELVRRALARPGAHANAVVMATVLPRLAPIEGRKVSWDGVARRIQVEFIDRRTDHAYTHSGSARVSSLRVTAFDPSGQMLFERVRGLEILVRITIDTDEFRVDDRPDLFHDDALLRDVVRAVFEPWIESDA